MSARWGGDRVTALHRLSRWVVVRRVALRLALVIAGAGGSGCVYYNGVYNAEASARQGDLRLRQELEDDARGQFQQSAARAESVLVRHPTSAWRPRALYLAGRGAALSGACEQGRPRLLEALRQPALEPADRHRARVALAVCDVQTSQLTAARARLDSVLEEMGEARDRALRDPETRRQASRWAGRAALAQGAIEAAARYLGGTQGGLLPWELLGAALAAREYPQVESLLIERASRDDYREDALRAVRTLAAQGRVDLAERIVAAYDRSRVRDAARATMHLALVDPMIDAGRDSAALKQVEAGQALAGRDTLLRRELAARASSVAIRRSLSLRAVDSLWVTLDTTQRQLPVMRRVGEQLLLLRLLTQRASEASAGTFLAAEIARDSLRAPRLAAALFLRVAREGSAAPLAPQALYAASLLLPDSAEAWRQEITTLHGYSSVAARLRGDDPAGRPDFVSAPELLRFTWAETSRVWADSVRRLRQLPRASGRSQPL